MSFDFGQNFEQPFFGGGVSAATAANKAWPVSLGGIPYMLDTKEQRVKHESIPDLRPAQEQKDNASRGTLSPEAFWRRVFESWHVGAGQSHFDRVDESNSWRFKRSRGVNVWNKYQLSLLPDTDQKISSANTNLRTVPAGSFFYLTDGTALKYTQDITVDTPTWTTVTGGTAASFTQIASDGFNVLLACGTSAGIDKTTRGAATKTNHITGGTITEVAYGKGRWLASNGAVLYDITTLVAGGGALPTALFTHPNSDFAWNCFAEGPTALYAGGFSGDKSLIYRLTMKEDGTGLNQPVVAGFLPDGEIIRSMQAYLGFLLIGTDKGLRVGIIGGSGDVTVGAFIPTDAAVRCMEGQDHFVWFGWSSFEGAYSGLGRVDLETFSDIQKLAPAYASDILVPSTTATVQSVATFQNIRVFTISGSGVYAEHLTNLVPTGEIDTGLFDYGLADDKVSLYVDFSHVSSNGGTHSVYLSQDRGIFNLLATQGDSHFPVPTGEARGREFELRIVLNRSGSDVTKGPIAANWALRIEPAVPLIETIEVPLLIGPEIHRLDKVREYVNPIEQIENIKTLRNLKTVTQYTEAGRGWSVVVLDYVLDENDIYIGSDQALGINGRCLVRLKVVT